MLLNILIKGSPIYGRLLFERSYEEVFHLSTNWLGCIIFEQEKESRQNTSFHSNIMFINKTNKKIYQEIFDYNVYLPRPVYNIKNMKDPVIFQKITWKTDNNFIQYKQIPTYLLKYFSEKKESDIIYMSNY